MKIIKTTKWLAGITVIVTAILFGLVSGERAKLTVEKQAITVEKLRKQRMEIEFGYFVGTAHYGFMCALATNKTWQAEWQDCSNEVSRDYWEGYLNP